jgi:hypothetical protein
MLRVVARAVAMALVLTIAPVADVRAQEFRATLAGRVTDADNLPLPGAAVIVTRSSANATHATVTAADGAFTVPYLVPGIYAVRVELEGFKAFTADGFNLAVGQTLVLPVRLILGDVSETVVVAARPIEAAKADRGSLVDNQRVTELPLSARNPFMLSTLAAGITFNGPAVFQRPFDNGAIADWSINGGLNRNNDFLLDGAPNNAIHAGNNIAYVPPVEAVHEFSVVTNAYDSQYGRTGGGVINVSLKSGSNVMHGAAYEFARRSAWDAGSFLENAHGGGDSGHFLDQYGFELDGPLRLGRVYDGRDRTFFMVSYEGYREGTPNPLVLTFPDERQRLGDFSGLRDAGGNPIIIYDPATGRFENGAWVRDPFPGNIIPANRIDPIAARLLSYFPAPNTLSDRGEPWRNNFVHAPNLALDAFHNAVVKVDHVFGDGHRAFARYAANRRTERRTRNGIASGPAQDGQNPLTRLNHAAVADWLRALSPSWMVNLRGSLSTYVNDVRVKAGEDFDLTELGFPAFLADQLPGRMFPRITLGEYTPLGRGSRTRLPTTVLAVMPSATWIRGSHTFRAGGDTRWTWYAPTETGFPSMRLSFDRGFTQRNFDRADALSGNAIASFLLGAPASGVVDVNLQPAYRWTYIAPWVQHDWRVSGRLTLNLGLRWDYSSPVGERAGRLNAGFDREAGGLLFVGSDGAERPHRTDWNNLQPRAGLAYRINDRTVLRGGIGRFFLNPTTVGTSHGYSVQTAVVASLDGNRTPAAALSSPFPDGPRMPEGHARGTATLLGGSPTFSNPNFDVPSVTQFSAGLLREFPWEISVEAAYVGSRTRNAPVTWSGFNEPPIELRDRCDITRGGDPAFCRERLPNPYFGEPGFEGTTHFTSPTLSRYDLARPYPQFAAFSEVDRNDGRLWYDALQASLNKRLSHGVSLNAAYTFARTREQLAFRDDVAGTIDRSPYFADRPHRLTLSAVIATPVVEGPFGPLLSDWTLSGVFIQQSGRPWDLPADVFYANDASMPLARNGGYIQGVARCVAQLGSNGALVWLPYSRAEGCSTPNFIVRPPFSGRTTVMRDGSIRLPGSRQLDIGVARILRLHGRTRLQLRAEVFNVLNEPMYDERQYVSDVFSSDFGRVNRNATPQSNFPRHIQLAAKLLF